jgi:ribosomal protein S18 acetylase RimI-like enzyme
VSLAQWVMQVSLSYDFDVTSSTPIFATADIVATLNYYKDVLGFDSTWTWGEPPTFGGASCGGASIMFNLQPDLASRISGHQHWINVDDADSTFADHRARGAEVVESIEDRPWGFREYVLVDPSGYHLRFAGPVSAAPTKSAVLPEGVQIVRRKPEAQEFARVTCAAFDSQDSHPEVLEVTWNGVVAQSPGGETIGVLRIMHDAPGWFSIWDVAVIPDWQSQRVGSALMEEAMSVVREESPGAFVFLFTTKHKFYERLGFAKESVSMRRV